MRIKPEVYFRFSPPTNLSNPVRSWWSVPNLVKIGEELRTLSSYIHTHTRTERRRNPLAPLILLSTRWSYYLPLFAILATWCNNDVDVAQLQLLHRPHITGSPVGLSRVNGAQRCSRGKAILRNFQHGLARSIVNRMSQKLALMLVYRR